MRPWAAKIRLRIAIGMCIMAFVQINMMGMYGYGALFDVWLLRSIAFLVIAVNGLIAIGILAWISLLTPERLKALVG